MATKWIVVVDPKLITVVTKKTLAGVEWEMNPLNLKITLYLVYNWRLIPSIKKQSSEMLHLCKK